MVGSSPDVQLTGRTPRVEVAEAADHDDAELRQLLRRIPTPGRIALTFEREPSYFAAAGLGGAEEHTAIAREDGLIRGLGRCTIRPMWFNGAPRRIAYLSELRLLPATRAKRRIFREGFAAMRTFARPADLCFTSVAADNVAARRLLEANLPGFPRYLHRSDYLTVVIPTPKLRRARVDGIQVRRASADLLPGVATLLNAQGARAMLSPYWTVESLVALERHGLRTSDICLAMRGHAMVGCAGLWDQRSFRQNVIRGYSPLLGATRPLVNRLAPCLRRPQLPPVGAAVPQALVSPFALAPGAEYLLPPLVRALGELAGERGVSVLTFGFDGRDPLAAVVRGSFGGLTYRTRLYEVQWPDHPVPARPATDRLWQPDVALL